ncbi:MAG: ferritin-like domain-containing protein [Terracidiphilus sp.]
MSTLKLRESLGLENQEQSGLSRRAFFKQATILGATAAAAGTILTPAASALSSRRGDSDDDTPQANTLAAGDKAILIAAEIAEALAVTTYMHIIKRSPFFKRIPDDDQNYLEGALQEEMSHYALEQSVTNENTPFDEFFYPKNMFEDTQTTLNTLVTLEDAFIAAYLVGVRNFSSTALRVTAARIMGIESDHRTLARVIGPDVARRDGGPITFITGAQGFSESVAPPNNNGYERTLCWTDISQAVTALTPFVDKDAAASAGFDTAKFYKFKPFTPTLPNPHGDFFSFGGC